MTSAKRLDALPDLPTVARIRARLRGDRWYGIGAPKNTPAEVVDKLNNEINAVLADPTNKARLIGLGADPILMTSSDFGKFMVDETKKWGKVIRESNIKPD